ncbi:MAG: hypothetical protein QOJ39_1558 [Candidatus Eremiobacteraeota bacterium]|jgi:hypothetical protein|nr:hypothetical protein [Candidatus Eremiobacteraeota bacterium]MEA2719694.1 hypothetical protein [Candidatus Eremiobacteraeota bacterium]
MSNSTSPLPRPDLNGLIVQQPGNAAQYLVFNGLACHIPDPPTEQALFAPINVNQMDLSGVARGPELSRGSLVIVRSDGYQSFFTNGVAHHIPNPSVLQQYSFRQPAHALPNDDLFNAIPRGVDVAARASIPQLV